MYGASIANVPCFSKKKITQNCPPERGTAFFAYPILRGARLNGAAQVAYRAPGSTVSRARGEVYEVYGTRPRDLLFGLG